MKQYLSLSDLSIDEIERLLALARKLQANPLGDYLRGKVVGLLFMNPSLRTLASMQAGIAQLGGSSFVIQPGQGSWAFETRDGAIMDGATQEHIKEAIPVLAHYCDILGVRCFADNKILADDLADALMPRFASLFDGPFMNLESAADHPCQALADWKTLDDLQVPRDGKFVLSWGWHPRALPHAVPIAAAKMAVQRGMDLTICHPPGFEMPPVPGLQNVRVTNDRKEAFDGADAVYVKSWSSCELYGQPEREAEARKDLREWCAKESWFQPAKPNAKLMHCLPVRRNVEIADELLDGPRSVVIAEAGNRLHVQKAILATIANS
jgi:N-acetylornithine carbamoyltransferase